MISKQLSAYCELYDYIPMNRKTLEDLSACEIDKMHTDIYTVNPYRLLLRSEASGIKMLVDDDRIIIRSSDEDGKSFMNIPIEDIFETGIDNCIYKRHNIDCYEIVFKFGDNILYKMIFNF